MSVMAPPIPGVEPGGSAAHQFDFEFGRWPAPRREPPSPRQWQAQFAELVIPLLGRLEGLARRILRSDDLAEDAVQEALVRLWRVGAPPPNPAGWLTRAVVHRSLHLNRCRRRRRTHEERACLYRPESSTDTEASLALEAGELGARIDEALARLPEDFRKVFVLREVEEMDYASIARTLEVPLGTVRSRLSRSREALQEALGGCARPVSAAGVASQD